MMRHFLVVSALLAPTLGACPSLWTPVGNECYKVSLDPMNWYAAEQVRRMRGKWKYRSDAEIFLDTNCSTASLKEDTWCKSTPRTSRQELCCHRIKCERNLIACLQIFRLPCRASCPGARTTGSACRTRRWRTSSCGRTTTPSWDTRCGTRGSPTIATRTRTVSCW